MLRAENEGGGSGGGQGRGRKRQMSEGDPVEIGHKKARIGHLLKKPHRRGNGKADKQKPRRRRATGSNNAPFNSTQFIMNDHVSEATKHLDSTLNVELKDDDESSNDSAILERPVMRITRARESSFSIDSDEDYYYSSPEDEEEFLNKEFIKDYDNVRTDRLIDMSKTELINEYLQMEQKIESLEKRLAASTKKVKAVNNEENMADTIKRFQKEIQRLETENDKLKHKNACSSSCASSCCSSSESDSESSSESSDDSSDSSEDEDEDSQVNLAKIDKMLKMAVDAQDDTGYESGQSNGLKKALLTEHTTNSIDPNEEKEVSVNIDEDEVPDLISVNCITSTSP